MPQWNHELLGRMLAPGIADFTAAEIPSVSNEFPELEHWIPNHFLSSVFGPNFQGASRILAFNLIYRTQNSIVMYGAARDATLQCVQVGLPSNPSATSYFRALSQWEFSFLSYSIAVDTLRALVKSDVFTKQDGSIVQRAYDFANAVKHHGNTVSKGGQIPMVAELIPAPPGEPPVIPLWLSNTGLHSGDECIEFPEYAKSLIDLGRVTEKFLSAESFIKEFQPDKLKSPIVPA